MSLQVMWSASLDSSRLNVMVVYRDPIGPTRETTHLDFVEDQQLRHEFSVGRAAGVAQTVWKCRTTRAGRSRRRPGGELRRCGTGGGPNSQGWTSRSRGPASGASGDRRRVGDQDTRGGRRRGGGIGAPSMSRCSDRLGGADVPGPTIRPGCSC